MKDRPCTPGNPMWGMPVGSIVTEQESQFDNPRDTLDPEVQHQCQVQTRSLPVREQEQRTAGSAGTAKQTVEIIGFGDPVAQPGQYVPSVCKDNPEAYPNAQCVEVEKEQDNTITHPVLTGFEQNLRRLINAQSVENLSNTPDFILAEYLSGCLNAFNYAVQRREQWYGRKVF
jgi:hypothetical protein